MRIGILITNTDRSDFAARWPDDGAKWRALLGAGRPGWDLPAFDLVAGRFPDLTQGFDGFVIGGSPASVHDRDPWIARLQRLILDANAGGVRLFGACFGHQAIAQALGGTVARNPGGWVFGVARTMLEGAPIRLCAAHSEQVVALPPGLMSLGGNAACPVGAIGGPGVLTTQYHPEMTSGFIQALVEEYAPKLPPDLAEQARASLAEPAETVRIASRIAAFFEDQESAASRSIAVT